MLMPVGEFKHSCKQSMVWLGGIKRNLVASQKYKMIRSLLSIKISQISVFYGEKFTFFGFVFNIFILFLQIFKKVFSNISVVSIQSCKNSAIQRNQNLIVFMISADILTNIFNNSINLQTLMSLFLFGALLI